MLRICSIFCAFCACVLLISGPPGDLITQFLSMLLFALVGVQLYFEPGTKLKKLSKIDFYKLKTEEAVDG